jgi:hypothetical protein
MKTKSDLAGYLDISVRELNRILYSKSRDSYYRTILFYKRAGGIREINAVEGDLKNIQEKLLTKLSEDYLASIYCHGFTKERSIFTNASYHVKKKFLIKFDIKDFFPSIGFPRVQGMFMHYPFSFSKEVSVTLAHICSMGPGVGMLPQGGVTSPYVANMICRKLDSRLWGLAKNNNCNFTRYADDITFSTDDVNKLKIRDFEDRVCSIISEEGFEVNESKTKQMWPYHRQVVTGIIVNKKINVNRSYIRNLRAILYNCEKKGIESQIVKNVFKQEKGYRNSRLNIIFDGEWYILNGNKIDKEEATIKFLNHIKGRLFFVGQVIKQERIRNPKSSSKVYERLLLSFYKIIKSDKKLVTDSKEYQKFKGLVECEMRKFPELNDHTDWESRKIKIKKEVRERMEKENKTLLQKLGQIKNDQNELNEFKKNRQRKDLRFFLLMVASAEKMKEYLSYPIPDYDKNFQLLMSMKNTSDGIGLLVHQMQEGIHKSQIKEIMINNFYCHYFCFHYELRKLFEVYFDHLEKYILKSSDDIIEIKYNDGSELDNRMHALKKETRFGVEEVDSTDLVKMINDLISKKGSKEKIKINNQIKERPSFYTVTREVEKALSYILDSMLKHSSEITISSLNSEPEQYSIIIYSDTPSKQLDMAPSRNFANGKIRKALEHLYHSGCKDYSIIAPFTMPKSIVQKINMFKGIPDVVLYVSDGKYDDDVSKEIKNLVSKGTFMHIVTFELLT